MTGLEVGITSICAILVLVFAGMHIPIVLALVSLVGVWVITTNFNISVFLLSQKSVETIASQEFAVIPLFVLMGLLISVSGIAQETFRVAHYVFGIATRLLLPIFGLVGLVIGGIYMGIFTPTESGAVGAAGALCLTLAKRRLTLRTFWQVCVETGHITASICFMIIAASMYSSMLGLSGAPSELKAWVVDADLSLLSLILAYVLIVVIMGTLLDSTLLIVVPIFLPLLSHFGVDMIWFGILSIIVVEVGLLTPPLGIAVFAVKSCLPDGSISLNDIFLGAMPFGLIMLLVTDIIVTFPQILL